MRRSTTGAGRRENARLTMLIAGLIFLGGCSALHAQERAPFLFDVEFDWLGLGVSGAYRGLALAPDADTLLRAVVLAVYDRYGYFRTPADEPLAGWPAGWDPAGAPWASRLSLRAALELDQGVLWHERDQRNRLEFFFAWRFRYERNFDDPAVAELLFASALPDREELLQNSLFAGVEWRDVDRRNRHRVLSGTQAELSVEWGPGWLANGLAGGADFLRLNLTARAFLPLFDLQPDAARNELSAYACVFAAVDFATGASVPLNIRGTFGGRSPRKGLGYAVRGLEDNRFDAPFKAVVNAEVRLNLPAFLDPSLIPGLLAFFDTGFYHYVARQEHGFVCSAGGGIFLSMLDALNLVFYTQVLLNETKVTGEAWTPLYFAFVFHF